MIIFDDNDDDNVDDDDNDDGDNIPVKCTCVHPPWWYVSRYDKSFLYPS